MPLSFAPCRSMSPRPLQRFSMSRLCWRRAFCCANGLPRPPGSALRLSWSASCSSVRQCAVDGGASRSRRLTLGRSHSPRLQLRFDAREKIDGAARQLPDQCMTDSVCERPIIAEPLVLRHPEGTHAIGQVCEMTFFRVKNDVVAVPMLNSEIIDDLRANVVNRDIASIAELLPPIFKRLLVDVVFAALTRDCGREHHKRSVIGQHLDKIGRPLPREMLRDFEALHQVEA